MFDDTTKWMINKCVFLELVKIFGSPAIHLFASRLNKQVTTSVSWKPDPDALFIDAFSRSWQELNFYAFPRFNVVGRCINKIKKEKAQGMIILPLWPSQTWFPISLQMMTSVPFLYYLLIPYISHTQTRTPTTQDTAAGGLYNFPHLPLKANI